MATNCPQCGSVLADSKSVLREDWHGVRVVVTDYPTAYCPGCTETYWSGRAYRIAVLLILNELARATGKTFSTYFVGRRKNPLSDLDVLAALEKMHGRTIKLRYCAPRGTASQQSAGYS